MSRPARLLSHQTTSSRRIPFLVNALLVLLILGLRFKMKVSWPQPTLTLAQDLSPASWVASRLAQLVVFLQDFTSYLLA